MALSTLSAADCGEILYRSVIETARANGANLSEHPWSVLNRASQAFWIAAWNQVATELVAKDHVFGHWQSLKALAGQLDDPMWDAAFAHLATGSSE